jgi:transcriptional regulator PpsR
MFSSDNVALNVPITFRSPEDWIGTLDADAAARLMVASNDVAMVIDREGIIRDIAVTNAEMSREAFDHMVERRWVDTVTEDSRRKVEEILRDASTSRESAWREVNQQSGTGSIPVRFRAIDAGSNGLLFALGRDLRNDHAMQQRILQTQQAMERDYVKLRQAEQRYRVLFQVSSEPVLIVDPISKKIIEANPAAGEMIGTDYSGLSGQVFAKLFHPESREIVTALLNDTSGASRSESVAVRLADGRDGISAIASTFRQDGVVHALVSLSKTKAEAPISEDASKQKLLRVLNRIPDAFVVTDDDLTIIDANLAFLELSQLISVDAAKQQPLSRFLGRPGVDLRVLMRNLQDHGAVRNFGSIVRTVHGDQEEVELSAVSVRNGLDATHGFVIRPVRRATARAGETLTQLPRTAQELTQLVGRVSLKEIVAETTDVIEQMCIKAALAITGNNRASAAEILGLSRQSLYSKLGRHGMTGDDPNEN